MTNFEYTVFISALLLATAAWDTLGWSRMIAWGLPWSAFSVFLWLACFGVALVLTALITTIVVMIMSI